MRIGYPLLWESLPSAAELLRFAKRPTELVV